MGISIDGAFRTWKKETRKTLRPAIAESMAQPEECEEDYHSPLINNGCYTCMGKFSDGHFADYHFGYYKKATDAFLDDVEKFEPSAFRDWLLSHRGSMIWYDYNKFHATKAFEERESETWVGYDPVPLHEDGKLLFKAASNLNDMYGCGFSQVMVSSDELRDYDEEGEHASWLDAKLERDATGFADVVEFAMERAQKWPNDEFFEERTERAKMLADAVRQGAKFVYSV